jgi:serine/threonine-protein kinase
VSLTPGAQIGAFSVLGLIGQGGMGKVYRARDARLKREVALKVLPAEFAADPDRVARFQREAQILATLTHQNIAAIHGVEESPAGDPGPPAVRALVMELVEGPTLADRIDRGAIPVDEALLIARQLADALDYAHEHGILHRDLKPANIKITPEGQVKVLDFGLAKALHSQAPAASPDPSPTITSPAFTQAGVIASNHLRRDPNRFGVLRSTSRRCRRCRPHQPALRWPLRLTEAPSPSSAEAAKSTCCSCIGSPTPPPRPYAVCPEAP